MQPNSPLPLRERILVPVSANTLILLLPLVRILLPLVRIIVPLVRILVPLVLNNRWPLSARVHARVRLRCKVHVCVWADGERAVCVRVRMCVRVFARVRE